MRHQQQSLRFLWWIVALPRGSLQEVDSSAYRLRLSLDQEMSVTTTNTPGHARHDKLRTIHRYSLLPSDAASAFFSGSSVFSHNKEPIELLRFPGHAGCERAGWSCKPQRDNRKRVVEKDGNKDTKLLALSFWVEWHSVEFTRRFLRISKSN
jgi:hypothetical protein